VPVQVQIAAETMPLAEQQIFLSPLRAFQIREHCPGCKELLRKAASHNNRRASSALSGSTIARRH
jgi:hypothetical protein